VNRASIFILIDGLGWKWSQGTGFLERTAPHRVPLRTVLGYSAGVLPSILTGLPPSAHGIWAMYRKAAGESLFSWTRVFALMPRPLRRSRLWYHLVYHVTRRLFRVDNYFHPYFIPLKHMNRFDLSARRNIFKPGSIAGSRSIFDVLKAERVPHRTYAWGMSESEMLPRLLADIRSRRHTFFFVYWYELDALLHRDGLDGASVHERLRWYDEAIARISSEASSRFDEVRLCVFSDHGMHPVSDAFDVQASIERLDVRPFVDYVPFYDATMARFWFDDARVGRQLEDALRAVPCGRVLSDEELRKEGVCFEDARYGRLIFLLAPSSVIVPSFVSIAPPRAMHGYHPDDELSDAACFANWELPANLTSVLDLYGLMTREAALAPRRQS